MSQLRDFLESTHKSAGYILPASLAAAAAGGLGGGVLTARGEERPEESRSERRNRILKNSIMGALGAGAGVGLGMYGVDQIGTAAPTGDDGSLIGAARSPLIVGGLGAGGYAALGRSPQFNAAHQGRVELLTEINRRINGASLRDEIKANKELRTPGGFKAYFDQTVNELGGRGRVTRILQSRKLPGGPVKNLDRLLMRAGMEPTKQLARQPNWWRIMAERAKTVPGARRLFGAGALMAAPFVGPSIIDALT